MSREGRQLLQPQPIAVEAQQSRDIIGGPSHAQNGMIHVLKVAASCVS
jgi:hypothetical protein